MSGAQIPPSDVEQHYGPYDWPVSAAAEQQQSSVSTDPCPICFGTSARTRFVVDRLDSLIVECKACGTARFFPALPSALVSTFYPSEYYGSTGEKFRPLVEALVRTLAARQAGFIARQIPLGGKVLDIGCGRGTLLSALARQGFESHGFELTANAALGLDPRIELRTGSDLREAAYPAQWFDAVVLWHVLEHLSDPRAVIQEIHRVLRPGGLLVVAVPNYSSWQARWAGGDWFHLDVPRHLFHFPISAIKTLLASCGFACQTSHHFSMRQNPFGWVQSALNKWGLGSRNALYLSLHSAPLQTPRPISATRHLWLRAAFLIWMPLGLFLSALEALFRQGGTIHIVARRRSVPRSPLE